jgi:hypothetical protein
VPQLLHRPAGYVGSSGALLLVLHEANASTATFWTVGLILVLNGLYLLASRLFPQDSADRLAWWKVFWSHREHAQHGCPGRAATERGSATERPEAHDL